MQSRLAAAALAIGAMASAPAPSVAQSFPSRPITVVVPFPAGGPTDALLRVLSDRMRASLGQALIALRELIAWAKASPRPVTAGTPGIGSIPQVAGILFENLTGARLQFVPYRGAAPSLQDLIAGQIDIMFDQVWNSLAQVRAGTIRAYAVTAPTRLDSASDIPTVDEAGLPGLHATVWNGFWVPKGTPKDVVVKLNAAVTDALADPTVRQRLADLGLEIPPPDQQTPEALGRLQQAETAKWWPIVKAANIKLE